MAGLSPITTRAFKDVRRPTSFGADDSGPRIDGNFGWDSSNFTVPVYCNGDDLDIVIKDLLGNALAEGDAIKRVTPARLPKFPNMRAKRISGIKGIGYGQQATGNLDEGLALGSWPYFDQYEMQVQFGVLDFMVPNARNDKHKSGDVPKFYIRSFPKSATQSVRFPDEITWTYAEGADNTKNFSGDAQRLLPQTNVVIIWYRVPSNFVEDGANKGMPNIEKCVGKINNNSFMGYPAGTLLCHEPDFEEAYLPWAPLVQVAENVERVPRTYNIKLNFTYFDPDTAGPTQGWQLMPNVSNSLWAKVTGSGGQVLFETIDFLNIFTKA